MDKTSAPDSNEHKISRRRFMVAGGKLVTGAVIASAALAGTAHAKSVSSLAPIEAEMVEARTVDAAMRFKPMALPFDPAALQGLSEKLITSHHANNYMGAVKRLNAIHGKLDDIDWSSAASFDINGLKREELIANNSMNLHELYFNVLGGSGEPRGALATAMEQSFGSIGAWYKQFTAIGKALGGGSGWVILSYDPYTKRLVNSWTPDHTHAMLGGRPIMVLDMFEHAYQMDYGAKAGEYVDAFMKIIRWNHAQALYDTYWQGA